MWARFEDGFDRDEDIEDFEIPASAIGLFACSVTYCARKLTDGFVSKDKAAKLPGANDPANVAKLIEAKWWTEDGDGYWVRNYLKYNPSREEVESKREARAKAGRSGGIASGETRRGQSSNQNGSKDEASDEAFASLVAEANAQAKTNPVPVPGSRYPDPDSRPTPSPPVEDSPLPPATGEAAKAAAGGEGETKVKPGADKPKDVAEVSEYYRELRLDAKYAPCFVRKSPEMIAEAFYNYYEGIGWQVKDRGPVKNWKAAARNSALYELDRNHSGGTHQNGASSNGHSAGIRPAEQGNGYIRRVPVDHESYDPNLPDAIEPPIGHPDRDAWENAAWQKRKPVSAV